MMIAQDVRYAVRSLTKQRGFTVVAMLCLALGIGVNTVIFSCLNAILLRPFPYADPDALVVVTEGLARDGDSGGALSYPDYVDLASGAATLSSMGAYASRTFTLTGTAEPERVDGARISASLFATLGIAASRGRSIEASDDRDGAAPVALVSDGFWERRFSRDPGVIGRTIEIDGNPTTIVGVMPAGVRFPGRADMWLPHARNATEQRDNHYLRGIARLAPGATLQQSRAELAAIGRRLAERFPDTNDGWLPRITTLRDAEVGELKPVLVIMQVAVMFVLLIACANVANLLLARGAARHREIAIRTTLGASRRRILRQLMTESVLIALAAGAFGALLASWGLELVVAMLPQSLPSWMQFTLDGRVLAFTFAVSLATGLVFGIAPALEASRPDLTDALKDGARGAGGSRSGNRLRSILVVLEVAMSLMLLIGASLMMKSFLRLESVNPGFDYRGSLSMQLALVGPAYDSTSSRWMELDRIVTEVSALPGVRGAGAVSLTPLAGSNAVTGFVKESEAPSPANAHDAEVRSVTAGYFRAMGIALVRGRTFSRQEEDAGGSVTIVSQTFAARYFPNEDVVGKRIRWGVTDGDPLLTIVGVVADVKHRQLGAAADPQMWVPYTSSPYRTMTLMVATPGDPASLATPVRDLVHRLAPTVPLYGIETMREVYNRSVWQPRLYGALFSTFAAIALLLAAAGVYGVIAYAVSQRLHEIGVRIALGAQRRDVFRLVVQGAARLALIGIGLGTVAAFVATRVLRTVLYGVSPTDPLVFGAMAVVLLMTALVASYIPARRAAALDPLQSIRGE